MRNVFFSFHYANDIFRETLESGRPEVEARVHWARLFRSRYNHRDASELLEEALEARPDDVLALVEMATVDVESDRDYAGAADRLRAVLKASPECVPAHNLMARIDIENERPAQAARRLEKHSLALAPNDLEALSLLGAATALLAELDGERCARKKKKRPAPAPPFF